MENYYLLHFSILDICFLEIITVNLTELRHLLNLTNMDCRKKSEQNFGLNMIYANVNKIFIFFFIFLKVII